MALYSSAIVMKGFISSRKSKIVTVKLKVDLLLNASLRICPLTFINEALRLSVSPFEASNMSPYFSMAGVHNMLC